MNGSIEVRLRGKRQRERARWIIDHFQNAERVKWKDDSRVVLLLAPLGQFRSLAQWIINETLLSGTSVVLEKFWQDCDCPGGYTESGTKKCQGHRENMYCSWSGYTLRWWLRDYKNSHTCNGIVGYIDGVRIGGL